MKQALLIVAVACVLYPISGLVLLFVGFFVCIIILPFFEYGWIQPPVELFNYIASTFETIYQEKYMFPVGSIGLILTPIAMLINKPKGDRL